jgi:hypothetical protein
MAGMDRCTGVERFTTSEARLATDDVEARSTDVDWDSQGTSRRDAGSEALPMILETLGPTTGPC